MLIAAGREGRRLPVDEVCEQLKMSPQELREDISVLNVVNFGGGAYVIYAEVLPSGEIEVDPEPYSDTFDRPARLLPIEAKALVAAIDLLNLAQPELGSAREKVVAALGHDPVEEGLQITSPTVADDVAHTVERAVHENRLLRFEYWNAEGQFSRRTVEPYALFNGLEAWYVAAYEDKLKHFRLDRIKSAVALDEHFERRPELAPLADVGGWPRTGEIAGSQVARVWISPEQARWAREKRNVIAEMRGRRDRRRAAVPGPRLPGQGDPQGGRRRGGARAAGRARGGAGRRRAPARAQHVSGRRAQIAMSAEEVAAFLDEQRVVTCATLGRDGWPHLMPLWYVLRDGELWAWTYAKSQKVRNLERDARCTLQVETGDTYDQLRGVMIKADAVIHREGSARARRRDLRALHRRPGRPGAPAGPGVQARRAAVRGPRDGQLGPPQARRRRTRDELRLGKGATDFGRSEGAWRVDVDMRRKVAKDLARRSIPLP